MNTIRFSTLVLIKVKGKLFVGHLVMDSASDSCIYVYSFFNIKSNRLNGIRNVLKVNLLNITIKLLCSTVLLLAVVKVLVAIFFN